MNKKQYIQNEETANAVTHGLGILLGAAAGIWLFLKALYYCDPWVISSVLVYIVCMLFSYIASTLYHACRKGKRKVILRKFDHVAIYFHIAGTYTFFTLTVLRDEEFWGWLLFFIVWIVAIIGSHFSIKGRGIGSRIETVCYIIMGLVVVVAFNPLVSALYSICALNILWYIIAGGILYLVGALLYSFKKIPYIHSVFHIFVVGGSIFHLLAIAITLDRL